MLDVTQLIASRPWRLFFWAWQGCVIALVLAASGIVTADGCLVRLPLSFPHARSGRDVLPTSLEDGPSPTSSSLAQYNLAGLTGDVPTLALDYNTASAVWLWSSAVADLNNSLAFARALSSRIHGFNETTDHLLRRLIFIAVRTASYTTVLSIAGAVANSVWGDDDTLGFVAIGVRRCSPLFLESSRGLSSPSLPFLPRSSGFPWCARLFSISIIDESD